VDEMQVFIGLVSTEFGFFFCQEKPDAEEALKAAFEAGLPYPGVFGVSLILS